ncbi:MAG: lysophospholipid acyltransferase family protein [Rhodocyclaceae bacterium]
MAGLIFRLLGRLPLTALQHLGVALGWAVYLLSPSYRRNLRTNLEQAFPAQARELWPEVVAHTGRQMLELPYIWQRSQPEILRHVVAVSGWEVAEAARARGQGLFFVTPHLGCFDMVGQYIATHVPITVLFRPPKRAWLRPIMEAGRGRAGMRTVPADLSGVRALMRALRGGEAIGLLPDQVPSKGEGLWGTFFGRRAYTMTLAARLAAIPNTALVFVYAERLPAGGGFHLHFSAPPVAVEGLPAERVEAINRSIEALIRRCPAQYLWGYNRYKKPAGAPPPDEETRTGHA